MYLNVKKAFFLIPTVFQNLFSILKGKLRAINNIMKFLYKQYFFKWNLSGWNSLFIEEVQDDFMLPYIYSYLDFCLVVLARKSVRSS